MRKIFAILAVVISTSVTLSAQTLANGQVEAQNVNIQKISGTVSVNFDLDLSDLSLSANRGLVLTPIIAGISDTLRLPAIEILGRLRHLYWQRNGATPRRILPLSQDVIMETFRSNTMSTRFHISRG